MKEYLELAYALTVHKAQGSDFGSVIVVLPRKAQTLSSDIIYTALTCSRYGDPAGRARYDGPGPVAER